MRDRRLGVAQVTAERGLPVGARGDEPEHVEAPAGRDSREEPGDRRRTAVLERLRRHRQRSIVGKEGDDGVDVAALEGVGEPCDELTLRG